MPTIRPTESSREPLAIGDAAPLTDLDAAALASLGDARPIDTVEHAVTSDLLLRDDRRPTTAWSAAPEDVAAARDAYLLQLAAAATLPAGVAVAGKVTSKGYAIAVKQGPITGSLSITRASGGGAKLSALSSSASAQKIGDKVAVKVAAQIGRGAARWSWPAGVAVKVDGALLDGSASRDDVSLGLATVKVTVSGDLTGLAPELRDAGVRVEGSLSVKVSLADLGADGARLLKARRAARKMVAHDAEAKAARKTIKKLEAEERELTHAIAGVSKKHKLARYERLVARRAAVRGEQKVARAAYTKARAAYKQAHKALTRAASRVKSKLGKTVLGKLGKELAAKLIPVASLVDTALELRELARLALYGEPGLGGDMGGDGSAAQPELSDSARAVYDAAAGDRVVLADDDIELLDELTAHLSPDQLDELTARVTAEKGRGSSDSADELLARVMAAVDDVRRVIPAAPAPAAPADPDAGAPRPPAIGIERAMACFSYDPDTDTFSLTDRDALAAAYRARGLQLVDVDTFPFESGHRTSVVVTVRGPGGDHTESFDLGYDPAHDMRFSADARLQDQLLADGLIARGRGGSYESKVAPGTSFLFGDRTLELDKVVDNGDGTVSLSLRSAGDQPVRIQSTQGWVDIGSQSQSVRVRISD